LGVIDEICIEYPSTYEEMVKRGKGERSGLVALLDGVRREVERREKPVLAGLVVLLAKERIRGEGWREVEMMAWKRESGDEGGEAIWRSIGRLWTEESAVTGVEGLGELVDAVWEEWWLHGVEGGGFVQRRDEEKERGVGWREELRVLEGLWGVVVEAQESFWTDVW
jgi:hypothetical protein